MKKVVKYTESDIERIVGRILKEDLPKRELDRQNTKWRRGDFEPYERESQLSKSFGAYSDDVPPQVISYLRKNPRRFLQKFVEIYGMEKVLEYIGYNE